MALLIAIAGGSGSGKSTLAEALADALPPGTVLVMREDWYYHDAAALPGFDPATYDFDDVAARDHDLLSAHLTALKAGGSVVAPVYSFIHHGREVDGMPLEAAPIVVVEGAHLLCRPGLAALFDLKVFVDTPADIRFIRRLLRDQRERGRSADSIVAQYLGTVRPGHDRHTEPSRVAADLVLTDSTAAVRLEDRETVRLLIAPLLCHPTLTRYIAAL